MQGTGSSAADSSPTSVQRRTWLEQRIRGDSMQFSAKMFELVHIDCTVTCCNSTSNIEGFMDKLQEWLLQATSNKQGSY